MLKGQAPAAAEIQRNNARKQTAMEPSGTVMAFRRIRDVFEEPEKQYFDTQLPEAYQNR